MARPLKLTPEIQAAICKALAEGNTRLDAARHGGISYETLRRWTREGRRQKDGEFCAFCVALDQAETQAVMGLVSVIRKAAFERDETTVKRTVMPGGDVKQEATVKRVFDWRAAAHLLACLRPEDFGRRETEWLTRLEKRMAQLERERDRERDREKGAKAK